MRGRGRGERIRRYRAYLSQAAWVRSVMLWRDYYLSREDENAYASAHEALRRRIVDIVTGRVV